MNAGFFTGKSKSADFWSDLTVYSITRSNSQNIDLGEGEGGGGHEDNCALHISLFFEKKKETSFMTQWQDTELRFCLLIYFNSFLFNSLRGVVYFSHFSVLSNEVREFSLMNDITHEAGARIQRV